MPIFEITAPDGTQYEVEGPEGSTEEQALAQVQAQLSVPRETLPQRDATASMSAYDKMLSAAKNVARYGLSAPINLAKGAVDVAGLITDTPARVYDAVAGATGLPQSPQWAKPAQAFNAGLDALAGPEMAPQGAIERVVADVERGMGGAVGGFGAGQVLAKSASPVIQQIGQQLGTVRGAVAPSVTAPLASGVTREMGGGPVMQTVAGLTGAMAPGVAGPLLRGAGGIAPTQSAQRLIDEGVDLTPGQLNPGGKFDQLETAWENVPLIGPMIRNAKTNAEKQFRHKFIESAAAPGAKVAPSESVNSMLDDAYNSFDAAYDQVKGFPLRLSKGKPVIVNAGADIPLETAFRQAAYDRGVMATGTIRKSAYSWLQNQLTKPVKTSEDLLNIRSQLRAQGRKIAGTTVDDTATKEIFANAEDAVTKALESQLPKQPMASLRKTDVQYAKYKMVEDAVARGGNKPFTPHQATMSVKAATDKGSFARGGGPLRDLTSAAEETFAMSTPQTGARLASIGIPLAAGIANPGLGIPAAAGLSALTLTETGRRLARGGYGFQEGLLRVPKNSPAMQLLLEAQKE